LYEQSVLFSRNCFCFHSLSSPFLLIIHFRPLSLPLLLWNPIPPILSSSIPSLTLPLLLSYPHTHTHSLYPLLSYPPPRSHVSTEWMEAVPSQLGCTPSLSPHSTQKARTLYFMYIMQYLHIVDKLFALSLEMISVSVLILFSCFIRTS
jgi:hypothetical protein